MTDEERLIIEMIKNAMIASAEAWAVLNDALPVLIEVSGKTAGELSDALNLTATGSGFAMSMSTLDKATQSDADYWFGVCAETDVAERRWDDFLSPIRPSGGQKPEGLWLDALEYAASAMHSWWEAKMYAIEIADRYEKEG